MVRASPGLSTWSFRRLGEPHEVVENWGDTNTHGGGGRSTRSSLPPRGAPGQIAKAVLAAPTDREHIIAAAERSLAAPDWDFVVAEHNVLADRVVRPRRDALANPSRAAGTNSQIR